MTPASSKAAPQHASTATGTTGTPGAAANDHCDPDGTPLDVRAEPFGPSQERIDQAIAALLVHPRLREALTAGDHRLMSFALEHEDEQPAGCNRPADKRGEPCAPDRFVASVYDYAENRVLEIRGQLQALDPQVPGTLETRWLGHQPLPSGDEFAAAVEVVRHERDLRERLTSGAMAEIGRAHV